MLTISMGNHPEPIANVNGVYLPDVDGELEGYFASFFIGENKLSFYGEIVKITIEPRPEISTEMCKRKPWHGYVEFRGLQ